MIYIWWTHPKKEMTTRQRRVIPLGSNLSSGVIGAALSPARAKIVIPARAIRTLPKTKTTPPSHAWSRPNGKTGKSALTNRPYMKTRRTIIIFRSPRMR